MSKVTNRQIANSVKWGMIETMANYVIRFVIGIILARLLTPNDYGLIGMITIFISISDVFVNAGFGQAFIQKKNASSQDADTVFIINFTFGIFVYGLFWICAPYIARFFNQSILTILIRVLFVIIIINSLNVIQQSIIRKEFLFKKRALLTVISSLFSGVIGIICAYNGYGVWSLVIQQICNKVVICILLYCTSTWQLSFSFSKESAKSMFSYGSWLMISNLISSIFNQFYRAFIGKKYSSDQLGLYDRAHQFESMIADTFTWVFGQVAFPVFSKVQDNIEEIHIKMYNFIRYSTFVVYPLLAILFVISKPLVVFLLTEKWLGCVSLLKCFCLVGLMVPLYTFLGPLLQGIGKAKFAMFLTILVCIGRIINVCVTYRWGIQYIIIGEFFVLLLTVIIISLMARKKIHYNYLSSISGTKWTLLSTAIILVVGLYIVGIPHSSFLQILFTSVIMGTLYLALMWICDKQIFNNLYLLVHK